MKVVYTPDQKREALALARREGIPAASRHYGVAKNTIYRWKAAMELNGLLEEDTVQENTTGELNEMAEDTAPTASIIPPGETKPANALNEPGHNADSSAESEKQPYYSLCVTKFSRNTMQQLFIYLLISACSEQLTMMKN